MNKILALLFRSSLGLFVYFLVSLPKLVVLQKVVHFALFHTHTHTYFVKDLEREFEKVSEIFKASLALQRYLALHFF